MKVITGKQNSWSTECLCWVSVETKQSKEAVWPHIQQKRQCVGHAYFPGNKDGSQLLELPTSTVTHTCQQFCHSFLTHQKCSGLMVMGQITKTMHANAMKSQYRAWSQLQTKHHLTLPQFQSSKHKEEDYYCRGPFCTCNVFILV